MISDVPTPSPALHPAPDSGGPLPLDHDLTGEREAALLAMVIIMVTARLAVMITLPARITLPKITEAPGSWDRSHMIIESGPVMIKAARPPLPLIMTAALEALALSGYRQRWMLGAEPRDREPGECDHPELEPAEHDRATCVWCGVNLTLERL